MQKNKYLYANLKYIINQRIFIVFVCLVLVATFYFMVASYGKFPYFTALAYSITNDKFVSFCLLPFFLFFTLYIMDFFDKNTYYITRLSSKQEYIKELIKQVLSIESILYLLTIFLCIIAMNFCTVGDFSITFVKEFHMTNLGYMLYSFLKNYIFLMGLSLLFVLLCKWLKIKYAIIFYVIVCAFTFLKISPIISVLELKQMNWFIGNYMTRNLQYSSFGLDLLCTFIFTICLVLLILILYWTFPKYVKDVGRR